jgi:hypothetical protein
MTAREAQNLEQRGVQAHGQPSVGFLSVQAFFRLTIAKPSVGFLSVQAFSSPTR